MKRFVKMMLLSLYFSCMFSVLNAQAVYNKNFSYRNQGTVRVDLNGDGRAEVIKFKATNEEDYGYVLQITGNGQVVMNQRVAGASINDIYSNDRYIEIIVLGGEKYGLEIYRYNGKRMTRYAGASLIEGSEIDIQEITKLMKKGNYCFLGDWSESSLQIRSDGKGVISLNGGYLMYGDEDYRDGGVKTYYRVRKNYVRYKKDGYAIELEKEYYSSSWPRIAYKYPKTGSNKRVFIVKRGEPMKIIKWKVTPKYVYMQVKREGKSGTGWVLYERRKDYPYYWE